MAKGFNGNKEGKRRMKAFIDSFVNRMKRMNSIPIQPICNKEEALKRYRTVFWSVWYYQSINKYMYWYHLEMQLFRLVWFLSLSTSVLFLCELQSLLNLNDDEIITLSSRTVKASFICAIQDSLSLETRIMLMKNSSLLYTNESWHLSIILIMKWENDDYWDHHYCKWVVIRVTISYHDTVLGWQSIVLMIVILYILY